MRRLVVLAPLVALVALLAGCTPRDGDPCDHEGDYSTHTENGRTVSLSCKQVGVDRYEWRKV